MTALVLGGLLLAAAFAGVFILRSVFKDKEGVEGRLLRNGPPVLAGLIGLFLLASTSFVHVPNGKVGHLERVYGFSNMPVGNIIAVNGEKGPQARVLPPGFHVGLFINVTHNVTLHDLFEVPPGMCAKLRARDGRQLPPGEAFAEEFEANAFKAMIENAEFFLGEGGGFKGVQTSVLPPRHLYAEPVPLG